MKAATLLLFTGPQGSGISIHAAREGGDLCSKSFLSRMDKFQSTPPVKAATVRVRQITNGANNFNPRRP